MMVDGKCLMEDVIAYNKSINSGDWNVGVTEYFNLLWMSPLYRDNFFNITRDIVIVLKNSTVGMDTPNGD